MIPVSSVRDREAYQEFTIGTCLAVARAGFIQRMSLENSFLVESSFPVRFTRTFNSGTCSDLSAPRDHIEFEQLVSSRNRKSGWRRFEPSSTTSTTERTVWIRSLTPCLASPSTPTGTSQQPASGVRHCSRTSGLLTRWALFDREVISERSMHARVDHGRTNLKEVGHAEVRC